MNCCEALPFGSVPEDEPVVRAAGEYYDAAGTLRFVAPTMCWEGYVRLAFDEIRQASAGSPEVSRLLKAALDDLLTIAPRECRAAPQRQRDLLDDLAATADSRRQQRPRPTAALVPDSAGIGSGDGLVTHTDGQRRT